METMIVMITKTWWLWFFVVGVIFWANFFRPTLRLLRLDHPHLTRTFVMFTLSLLAFLAMGISLFTVYTQPLESLILTMPENVSRPSPDEIGIAFLQGTYVSFVHLATALLLKPFSPVFAFLIMGATLFIVIEEVIQRVKNRQN